MQRIDFFFDYLSPYAYLAFHDLEALCKRHDVTVRYRPVLFSALLDHWGQRGPAEIAPKAAHAFRDCLRHARLRGIPLRSPRFHPFRSLTALRATLAVPEDDRARAVRALFDLGWALGEDLGSAGAIAAALDSASLDGNGLIGSAETATIKAALRAQTDDAIARGVFGIPTLGLANEIFWGLDQFPHVERVLEGRDPIAGVDTQELRPQGRAAWRRGVPQWTLEEDPKP